MELMPEEIAAKLVAARDAVTILVAEGKELPIEDREIVVKYFTPDANCTWWITDGEQDGDDWLLFGFCSLGLGPECDELGYVSLSELKSVRGRFGLSVERDLFYRGHKLGEVMHS